MNAKATPRSEAKPRDDILRWLVRMKQKSQVPLGDERGVCGIVRNYRVHD